MRHISLEIEQKIGRDFFMAKKRQDFTRLLKGNIKSRLNIIMQFSILFSFHIKTIFVN